MFDMGFEGSQINKNLNSISLLTSPNFDTTGIARDILIGRSYALSRNTMFGAGAVNRCDINIVNTGIKLNYNIPSSLGFDKKYIENKSAEIEEKFRLCAEDRNNFSLSGRYNLYEAQSISLKTAIVLGDCFINFPTSSDKSGFNNFKTQVISGVRVRGSNINSIFAEGNIREVDGIKYAQDTGRLVSAQVYPNFTHDESSIFNNPSIIPFYDDQNQQKLFIVGDLEFSESIRGIPLMASIIEASKQFGRFLKGTIDASVIASFFSAFITTDADAGGVDDEGLGTSEDTPIGDTVSVDRSVEPDREIPLASGTITSLPAGKNVEFGAPKQPITNFNDFKNGFCSLLGCAIGIPYEEVLLQFNGSYSSARAAMLQAYNFYKVKRKIINQGLNTPYFRLWLQDSVDSGFIKLEKFDSYYNKMLWFSGAKWLGKKKDTLDDLAAVKASSMKIKEGLSTPAIEVAELLGEDYSNIRDNNIEQLNYRHENLNISTEILTGDQKDAKKETTAEQAEVLNEKL